MDVAGNLLPGSLIGAWWAAGHALAMSRERLLIGMALCMLLDAWFGLPDGVGPVEQDLVRWSAGLIAGFGIGLVAALLGVAGGELLIPTVVLLYGLDIKLAGSVSLVVSLPTMLVSFARYSRSTAFAILQGEQSLFRWMVAGSVLGVGLGGLLVGSVPAKLLMTLLAVVLLVSAAKTFRHSC